MDSRKLKTFSAFVNEEFPPPMVSNPPTNVADGTKIAGLPADFPPVPRRNKLNIARRKRRKA